jgi:hypothetical protein
MFKRMMTVGALVFALSACGGQKTQTPVVLDQLVVPTSAPWISVEQSQGDLAVRGLDEKLILSPSRSVSEVVQAQLRQALQPAYISNLTVACDHVKADLRVKRGDDAASTAILDVSMRCMTDARGFVTRSEPRSQPSAPVSAQTDYAKLFAQLLGDASKELAGKVQADIDASKSHLN